MGIKNIPGSHNENQTKTAERKLTMPVVWHRGPDTRLRMQGM